MQHLILNSCESGMTAASEGIIKQASSVVSFRSGLSSILLFIIGIALALYTASFISKPINVVTERMKRLANDELMEDTEEINRLDELGQLYDTTINVNKNLRTMFLSINNVSQRVGTNSEALAPSSSDVKAGTNQISQTMQQLSAGADIQAKKSTELSSNMYAFTATIQEATIEGTTFKDNSSNVQQAANTIEGISQSADILATMSEELNTQLKKFKL